MRGRHMRVEDLAGHRHKCRMGDPRPVVALTYLAQLVLPHFLQRGGVRGGVVLDGDLRGHPAQRVNAPAVARLDDELGVGAQERLVHGDAAPIGEHALGAAPELLDEAEDVVPAAAVETR